MIKMQMMLYVDIACESWVNIKDINNTTINFCVNSMHVFMIYTTVQVSSYPSNDLPTHAPTYLTNVSSVDWMSSIGMEDRRILDPSKESGCVLRIPFSWSKIPTYPRPLCDVVKYVCYGKYYTVRYFDSKRHNCNMYCPVIYINEHLVCKYQSL